MQLEPHPRTIYRNHRMAYDGTSDDLCSLPTVISAALALNYCGVDSTLRIKQPILMTSAVWVFLQLQTWPGLVARIETTRQCFSCLIGSVGSVTRLCSKCDVWYTLKVLANTRFLSIEPRASCISRKYMGQSRSQECRGGPP